MKKIIILAAVLLPAISAFASELTTEDLIVSNNATIYGNLNFYTVTGGTTNGASASGGDITMSGGYRIHTFTSNGAFEVSGGSLTCDVLVVAGGGGGGAEGGGGGGGGLIYTSTSLVAGSYTVTVGNGGGGGGYHAYPSTTSMNGTNGGNSVFGNITVKGGGGGGTYEQTAPTNGGSGGGGGHSQSGAAGTSGQGNTGGNGAGATAYGCGGGGGAGSTGINGTSGSGGGNGGSGVTNSISGSAVIYAGGGGGSCQGGTGGNGGAGGGGSGKYNAVGDNGSVNTGGGGGGGGELQSGGNGGSGIVIVRYPYTGDSNVIALTVSSNGINQASASGVNKFMGNVGIGTENPAEKLHVVGNVQVEGSLVLGGTPRTNWPSGAEGALMISNNLNDVADKPAARSNLGIGSAATNETGAFLTPTSDGSQLTNITAAQVGALSTNAGALIEANNLSELTDTASTARGNLGLGTAATNSASAFLTPTGNGSQLTGITAAQTGALSTNGGTMSGELTVLNPGGNIPMGVYTNQ